MSDSGKPGIGAASVTLLAASLIMGSGCGDGRLARTPVSGQVRVDGMPAAGAIIVLHPVAGSVPAEAETLRPTGTCDREGRFAVGTWELADGAPRGRWSVTVEWYVARAAGADADPESADSEVDRLGGRYADPADTPLSIEVGGSALQLPPFDLQAPAAG